MAVPDVPYPRSPDRVPDGLTDYPASYVTQQNILLASLFVFLALYVGMVGVCGLGGLLALLLPLPPVLRLLLAGFFAVLFLFLVKGFFKWRGEDKNSFIEVTEEEQPVLFAFIHKLVDELDAPTPNRVYLSFDVNAAVITRTSLVNLFVAPKRDLLIGLGLVNSTNLSEFKAVIAHEFGHFCQSSAGSQYTYVVSRLIIDMVEGEDWFDRAVAGVRKSGELGAVVGGAVAGVLWLGRKVLELILKGITLQRLAVMREQEFHADSVAASVAGSDAVTHCLLRAEFGHLCLIQAARDLALPADHKLYTDDLYYHQNQAAAVVRKKKENPKLGVPPVLGPEGGARVKVFDPDAEEEDDDDTTPPMWRTHPPHADREESVKDPYVYAEPNHLSPWVLFADAADLRARATYKFCKDALGMRRGTPLAPAEEVQAYIDAERADTTYDPKYLGLYDDRVLEPGSPTDLLDQARDAVWPDDRIEDVYRHLYDGARAVHDEYTEVREERAALADRPGRLSPRNERRLRNMTRRLDELWEWYQALDKRVFLVHAQMAGAVRPEWATELTERYRFQLVVQRFYLESRDAQSKALAFAKALFNADNPPPGFVEEVMGVLRASYRTLKKIRRDAQEVNLPAMSNFVEGDRLADFIFEGKMIRELPSTYIKGTWVVKLLSQLETVRARCFRLHYKSVGGILALQEKIAAEWTASRGAVDAEVLADPAADPVEFEVVDDAPPADAPRPTPAAPRARAAPSSWWQEAIAPDAVSADAVSGPDLVAPDAASAHRLTPAKDAEPVFEAELEDPADAPPTAPKPKSGPGPKRPPTW